MGHVLVSSTAGALEEVYNEILDLALDLTVKKVGCDGTRPHFEAIGDFFYNIKPKNVKVRQVYVQAAVCMSFTHQCFCNQPQQSFK